MEGATTGTAASRIPEHLVASVADAVTRRGGSGLEEIRHLDAHSNEVAAARFADGRTLMVKRGRFSWAAARFRTSRNAAALLREAGIAAPCPLPLDPGLDDAPLEAYWRLDLPTLEEAWPGLGEAAREGALRSLGRLARRLHRVRPRGFGPLAAEGGGGPSLRAHLRADLAERLLPAVWGEWEEGGALVQALLERLPSLAHHVARREPRLLHNDLHMGNVLCRAEDDGVSCVGLLDLEAAGGGVPEADLALLEVMHGPLFGRPVAGDWLSAVRRGYGAPLEPGALRFFRVYHLLNLGFYSALVGHAEHAAGVAEAARREAADLAAPETAPLAVAV